MLNDAKDLKAAYIVCGYTDLRKGIDSLSAIISTTYGMDPFQPGTLYVLWSQNRPDQSTFMGR